MKKKVLIIAVFFVFITCTLMQTVSMAAVAVTKANLTEALNKIKDANSITPTSDYKINVGDSTISIETAGQKYIINYSLSGKPTFSITSDVKNGMTLEQFSDAGDYLILPMIGYVGVANVQGVSIDDALNHIMLLYMRKVLTGEFMAEGTYKLVDDVNQEVDKSGDNSHTIYQSEFPNRVMDYVNGMFENNSKMTLSDSEKTFTITVTQENVTADSCRLKSTLVVNTDADFSAIKTDAGSGDEAEADYNLELKVGQKVKFLSSKAISSISWVSFDGAEVTYTEDRTEVTADMAGTITLELQVGEVEKTFKITITENTEGSALETVYFDLDQGKIVEKPSSTDSGKQPEQEPEKKPAVSTPSANGEEKKSGTGSTNDKKDGTEVKDTKLPQTGVSNTILFVIAGFVLSMIIMGIKLKKSNDIKNI